MWEVFLAWMVSTCSVSVVLPGSGLLLGPLLHPAEGLDCGYPHPLSELSWSSDTSLGGLHPVVLAGGYFRTTVARWHACPWHCRKQLSIHIYIYNIVLYIDQILYTYMYILHIYIYIFTQCDI